MAEAYNGDVNLERRVTRLETQMEERMASLNLAREILNDKIGSLNHLRDCKVDNTEYREAHKRIELQIHSVADDFVRLEKMQARMIGVGIALMATSALLGAVITHLLGWK
jgi:hypothetical protein